MVEWVSMVFGGRVVCNEDNAGHVFTSGAKLGWCFDWDPVGVGLVLEMVGLELGLVVVHVDGLEHACGGEVG